MGHKVGGDSHRVHTVKISTVPCVLANLLWSVPFSPYCSVLEDNVIAQMLWSIIG